MPLHDLDGDSLELTSSAFNEGEMIPAKYSCDGSDLSPPLAWDAVPDGTKSLALIVDDPDAPAGTWVHWLLADIPPDTRAIPEDAVPEDARQVTNDFSKPDYGGPCPPGGTHRYFFKLYALDVASLGDVNKKSIYAAVEEHALASAELMGRYKRQR